MEAGSLGTGPGRCLCRFWEDLFRLKSLCLGESPSPTCWPFLPPLHLWPLWRAAETWVYVCGAGVASLACSANSGARKPQCGELWEVLSLGLQEEKQTDGFLEAMNPLWPLEAFPKGVPLCRRRVLMTEDTCTFTVTCWAGALWGSPELGWWAWVGQA